MDLITPSIGLIFWTTLTFGLLLLVLGKFAWKPIMTALQEREASIENALASAEAAKAELTNINLQSEALLKEARLERDKILKEAKVLVDTLLTDAKNNAREEGIKIIERAHHEIESIKNKAMSDVKNQVSVLSIEIAEKILRQKFENPKEQESLVQEMLKEIKLN
jgi:F-type H+-transporting ATPase subunit b